MQKRMKKKQQIVLLLEVIQELKEEIQVLREEHSALLNEFGLLGTPKDK